MKVSKNFEDIVGCKSDAVVWWARRGSAPCRKARPGVLFMELKGWWGRCRKVQKKEPTSLSQRSRHNHNNRKIHYKSM